MSIIVKMVALSVCALASTAAMASSIPFESNGRTFEVAYKDLDLSKTADQRELTRRIRRAAIKVCPGNSVKESRACQLAALDHVRAPVAAAIASAQGRDAGRFAEVNKDKVPGSGD